MWTVSNPEIFQPLTPDKLLNILLKSSFKQQECEDQVSKIQQQKRLLRQLTIQYGDDIITKQQLIRQVEEALAIRAKLRVELETLRLERQDIDTMVMHDIAAMKKNPLQIRATFQTNEELFDLRDQNSRLGVRLQQLLDYSSLLQKRVQLIESDHKIRLPAPPALPLHSSFLSIDSYSNLDWRQKIHALKVQQKVHVGQYKASQIVNRRNSIDTIIKNNGKQNSSNHQYSNTINDINHKIDQPNSDLRMRNIRSSLMNQTIYQRFRL